MWTATKFFPVGRQTLHVEDPTSALPGIAAGVMG